MGKIKLEKIKLEDHSGHYGMGSPEGALSNGEIGIGKDRKGKKWVVVCCVNCGDYSWLDLEVIKAED